MAGVLRQCGLKDFCDRFSEEFVFSEKDNYVYTAAAWQKELKRREKVRRKESTRTGGFSTQVLHSVQEV